MLYSNVDVFGDRCVDFHTIPHSDTRQDDNKDSSGHMLLSVLRVTVAAAELVS